MPRKTGICQTGKVRWATKLDAQMAGANMARKGKDGARAYRCRFCGSWHLSGQAKGYRF